MKNPSTPEQEQEKDFNIPSGLLTCMVILWGFCLISGIYMWCAGNSEKAGQFGDWFGSVNALLTSLALAFAIHATRLFNQKTLNYLEKSTASPKKPSSSQHDTKKSKLKSPLLI